MQIGEICQGSVVSLDKDASIVEAAKAMRANHVGDVVVTESANGVEKPLGIVTDRDIVIELIAKEADLDTVNIGDVMSLGLVTARYDADLFETLRFMGVKGVRRIPVLDAEGGLYGILSVDDAVAILTKELSFMADISARQIERERTIRE